MRSGVNRFSLGVQAFQQAHLERCGRSHDLQDVQEAVGLMQQAQPTSWSLDLISGLPHLSMAEWRESLGAAIAARPPHISTYDLQIEDKTPFGRLYKPGEAPLPEDTEAAQMYKLASELLVDAGYEHYEVSSYALPGHRCRHNQVYWSTAPFYAFGMSAASYLGRRRITRPRSLKAYEQWVEALAEGQDPATAVEADSVLDQLLDMIMLSLRTSDGLSLQQLEQRFGRTVRSAVEGTVGRHEAQGLVSHSQPERIRLTDPEGFLLENDIVSDIFAAVSHDGVLQAGTLE
ncbi:hypothetical protein WJX84_003734 [Apatococcus fuscideae]|uniref:HemN C-terminal domain-containing protein n=1 Tax=Apatococcus fuscideae TaxID=2026836 RepID=A0AAW1TED9_9CHLO